MTPPESPVEPLCECACMEEECLECNAAIEAEALLLEAMWFERVDLGGEA